MALTNTSTFPITAKRMARCALLAALTAVCSQIAIPLPYVPINLALFAVYLSGSLLGPLDGFISQLVYVLVGAVGMPVFSSFRGGLAVLSGPTGGYIWGYLAAAFLVGLLANRWGHSFPKLIASMCMALVVCYAFGTAWFILLTGKGLLVALGTCVFPFLPGDAIKIVAAAALTGRLRHALHLV